MRDHDLELIAALAEGRLEDEAEARALIASNEEARAEYEAQKLALDALSGPSPVSMTETERASLRRDTWSELRSGVGTSSQRSTSPWYYRWVPVAAGMFVLVGLVAVLSQGGLDGIVSADQAATSETTLATSVTTMAMSEESGGAGDDADAGDGVTVTEAPTDTGTPPDTIADSGDVEVSEPATPAAAAYYSAEADAIRVEEESVSRSLGGVSATELGACLEQAGLDGYEALKANPSPGEGTEAHEEVPEGTVPYVAAIPFGEDLATTQVIFVSLETCEVIHVDQ